MSDHEGQADWMQNRTPVATVGQLREALSALADDFQMPILGFYDDGFGIARDVSVGIITSQSGEKFFAIEVGENEQ